MDAAFSLHQIAHMQSMLVNGFPIDTSKLHPTVRAQLEKARNGGGETLSPTTTKDGEAA